jgi:ADP-heptose:LPS heptosyltransferase
MCGMGPPFMTLVIFKVNQLGDNVVFLPVVQALSAVLKDWKIVVATSPVAARLYEVCCPAVTLKTFETADFNGAWRTPLRLRKSATEIRNLRPDACLLGDDQGSVAHLLARLSGAPVIVGPRTERVRLNALLNERVPQIVGEHVAVHNWRIAARLLERLELAGLPPDVPAPNLSEFGVENHGAVLIHAGASRAYKRWPVDRFVALANRIQERQPVIWIGQNCPEEEALSALVRREPVGTLDGFIRLMAGARHFVGNNSGPMNIASALGVQGTILNGPSSANWDPPWHADRFDLLRDPALACQPCDPLTHPANICQNREHPMTCMLRWSVEEVLAAVTRRLG